LEARGDWISRLDRPSRENGEPRGRAAMLTSSKRKEGRGPPQKKSCTVTPRIQEDSGAKGGFNSGVDSILAWPGLGRFGKYNALWKNGGRPKMKVMAPLAKNKKGL